MRQSRREYPATPAPSLGTRQSQRERGLSQPRGPTQTRDAELQRGQDRPDLHRDIVSLGFVKDVRIDGSDVSFVIELTTPACPVREQLEQQARQAVAALPGVKEVNITMTARVRERGAGRPRAMGQRSGN